MNEHVIDKEDVVLGQCIRVWNVERQKDIKKHIHECAQYIAIQVEDYSGKKEYCILLTHINHTDMESVQLPMSMMNNMVDGRLYPVVIARKDTYLIKVAHWDGRTRILRISRKQLQEATDRAISHPMSCTKKTMLTDMFD